MDIVALPNCTGTGKTRPTYVGAISTSGLKLLIDFAGLTIALTHRSTGEIRHVPIFTDALGASQRIFASAYDSQNAESWQEGLCDSFEFYGVFLEVLVPDNPKACVTSRYRYEPTINHSHMPSHHKEFAEWTPERISTPFRHVLQVFKRALADCFFYTQQTQCAARLKLK